MPLYAQVINGQIAQCIDTPPPSPVGMDGWCIVQEIRPDLIPNRQRYTDHTWNTSINPVQLIYGVIDISAEERQNQLKTNATSLFQQTVNQQAQAVVAGGSYDFAAVSAAHDKMVSDIAAIDAATTHDLLDALAL
jgi:hypothetical protein